MPFLRKKNQLQPLKSLFPTSAVKVEWVPENSPRERKRDRGRAGSERFCGDQMLLGEVQKKSQTCVIDVLSRKCVKPLQNNYIMIPKQQPIPACMNRHHS